jgi:hypothetical protein
MNLHRNHKPLSSPLRERAKQPRPDIAGENIIQEAVSLFEQYEEIILEKLQEGYHLSDGEAEEYVSKAGEEYLKRFDEYILPHKLENPDHNR